MVFLESTDHHLSFHNSKSCCDSFAKLKIFTVTLQHIIASIYHNKTSIQAPKCIEMHHSKNWKWLSKQSSSLIVNISACEIAPIGSPRSLKVQGICLQTIPRVLARLWGIFMFQYLRKDPSKNETLFKMATRVRRKTQQASRLSTAFFPPYKQKGNESCVTLFVLL